MTKTTNFASLQAYEKACPYEVNHEKLHTLENVQVIYTDQVAILKDFPWLIGESENVTTQNIHHWAKSMGGISVGHINGSEVNLPLPGTGTQLDVIRPPRYGRATIIDSAQACGMGELAGTTRRLCDLKGCGIRPEISPKAAAHSTGLLTLVEALVEVTNREILSLISKKSELEYQGLPVYAVLDLNFRHDGVYEKQARSALLIRRAHFRPEDNNEIPLHGSGKQAQIAELEKTINQYCLTSVAYDISFDVTGTPGRWNCSFAGNPVEIKDSEQLSQLAEMHDISLPNKFHFVNIQMAKTPEDEPDCGNMLVDFSHYCFTNFPETYIEIVPADDQPLNFGILREITPSYGRSSKRFADLEGIGFFDRKPLDERCRAYFGGEKMEKSYSSVVKFVHDLIATLDDESVTADHIDNCISDFVNIAIGQH